LALVTFFKGSPQQVMLQAGPQSQGLSTVIASPQTPQAYESPFEMFFFATAFVGDFFAEAFVVAVFFAIPSLLDNIVYV
jgi:hypothetical protein